MGRDVLYIHYEEGDPGSTFERLRLLSVTPQDIARHLRFVAPARPARREWLHALLDPPPALVIHDGVNEAMSLQGGRGLRGVSSVYVVKDRPGQLRAHGKPTGLPGKTFFGVLTVDASPEAGPDFLTFFAPKDEGQEQTEITDPAAEMAEAVYRVLRDLPNHTADSGRKLYAAMRDAGIKFTNTAARNAVDDLLHAHRVVEIPGKNNSVGYRAVVGASAPQSGPSASASASCGASPREGEAPTHSPEQVLGDSGSTPKRSEAPGEEAEELLALCRYCSTPLRPGMRSQIARGYCNKQDCMSRAREDQH